MEPPAENGWERRIRTPATWSRATRPTARRSPSAGAIVPAARAARQGRERAPAESGPLEPIGRQALSRVDRLVAVSHFEVDVRARGAAGGAEEGDNVPLRDALPGANVERAVVRVEGRRPRVVTDQD